MQGRGSNVADLGSLQPNLSSVPTPALLDPGCVTEKNKQYTQYFISVLNKPT